MSDDEAPRPERPTSPGGPDGPNADAPDRAELTSPSGTPVPVDITRDLEARTQWVLLLAGPVIWLTHFAVVYLVAEAGCHGDGQGLDLFDPPVPVVVTLVATLLAATACLAVAYRSWSRIPRGPAGTAATDPAAHERQRVLSTVGGLLALLSAVGVLVVAAPAVWLPC